MTKDIENADPDFLPRTTLGCLPYSNTLQPCSPPPGEQRIPPLISSHPPRSVMNVVRGELPSTRWSFMAKIMGRPCQVYLGMEGQLWRMAMLHDMIEGQITVASSGEEAVEWAAAYAGSSKERLKALRQLANRSNFAGAQLTAELRRMGLLPIVGEEIGEEAESVHAPVHPAEISDEVEEYTDDIEEGVM